MALKLEDGYMSTKFSLNKFCYSIPVWEHSWALKIIVEKFPQKLLYPGKQQKLNPTKFKCYTVVKRLRNHIIFCTIHDEYSVHGSKLLGTI